MTGDYPRENNLNIPPGLYNTPQPCPSCGHCPTCGRGPSWHMNTRPFWVQPSYVECGTTGITPRGTIS